MHPMFDENDVRPLARRKGDKAQSARQVTGNTNKGSADIYLCMVTEVVVSQFDIHIDIGGIHNIRFNLFEQRADLEPFLTGSHRGSHAVTLVRLSKCKYTSSATSAKRQTVPKVDHFCTGLADVAT